MAVSLQRRLACSRLWVWTVVTLGLLRRRVHPERNICSHMRTSALTQMPGVESWQDAEMWGSTLQKLSWTTLTVDPGNGQTQEVVSKFGNQSHSWCPAHTLKPRSPKPGHRPAGPLCMCLLLHSVKYERKQNLTLWETVQPQLDEKIIRTLIFFSLGNRQNQMDSLCCWTRRPWVYVAERSAEFLLLTKHARWVPKSLHLCVFNGLSGLFCP